VLGADSAVVIALASRKLPLDDTRRAVLLGAMGAIALRLVMILFANALLVPLVKLIGAWTLVVITLNVQAGKNENEETARETGARTGELLSVEAIIMLADGAMSLDNIAALAALAGGNLWLLATGVLLSIPVLAYGGLILNRITRNAPEILTVGAAILGWIAGEMAVSDSLLLDWIQNNAPALAAFAPPLVAAFVWFAGKASQKKQTCHPRSSRGHRWTSHLIRCARRFSNCCGFLSQSARRRRPALPRALRVSINRVRRWRRRCVKEGTKSASSRSALSFWPRSRDSSSSCLVLRQPDMTLRRTVAFGVTSADKS
jgi:YjbE family integral membrane protein